MPDFPKNEGERQKKKEESRGTSSTFLVSNVDIMWYQNKI